MLIDSARKLTELYALNMYALGHQHETTKQYASFVKEDVLSRIAGIAKW